MRGGNIGTHPVIAKSVRAIDCGIIANSIGQRVTAKASEFCNRYCNQI